MHGRSVAFAKKADIKPGELALFEVAPATAPRSPTLKDENADLRGLAPAPASGGR